jgi:hypothetical protein
MEHHWIHSVSMQLFENIRDVNTHYSIRCHSILTKNKTRKSKGRINMQGYRSIAIN